MLKKVFVSMALLVSMHSYGQTSATEMKQVNDDAPQTISVLSDTDKPRYVSYQDMELGYVHAGGANGAYIGYLTSSPFNKGKSPFAVDFGLKGQWSCLSMNKESYHSLALNANLGISWQIMGKNDTNPIVLLTGLMCGYAIPLSSGGEGDFLVGWDVGARIRWKTGYLSYVCTIGFKGGTTHSVGIGFDI